MLVEEEQDFNFSLRWQEKRKSYLSLGIRTALWHLLQVIVDFIGCCQASSPAPLTSDNFSDSQFKEELQSRNLLSSSVIISA